MDKRKILYVFCSENYSGAEIVIRRLLSYNSQLVDALAICPPGEFADSLRDIGTKVVEEPSLASLNRRARPYSRLRLALLLLVKFLSITKKAVGLCLKSDLDAVHANNLAASFYLLPSLFIVKLLKPGIRWIWSNHDLSYPNPSSFRLVRLCHRFYDKTLAVSQAVRGAFPEYAPKIEILYNGIDLNEFRSDSRARDDFRREHSIQEPAILIGIVGLITEGKGHHLLLEAFQRLADTFSNTYLFIVGRFSPEEEDYEARIRSTVADLPKARCRIIGSRRDIPRVYSGLDILVNATTSSRSEPLGTTIYEAMACERIVLASETGGTREIIEDGVDGFLFSADSATNLAKKLSWILRSYYSLEQVTKNAREKTSSKFDIKKMASRYNSILDLLLMK